MDYFKHKMSLGKRATINILLMAIILAGAAIVSCYKSYQDELQQQLIDNATSLAQTMAQMIDPDSIDRYLESGETDDEYYDTLEKLRIIQQNNNIVYAVVTKPTEEGFYYVYDTDTSDGAFKLGDFQPYYEGEFLDNKENFLAGNEIPTIISDYEFGWLLSALVPIKNDDGEMCGYVDVDMSMNEIRGTKNNFLVNVIWLLAIILLVIVLGSIYATRQILVQPINALSEAAENFVFRQNDGSDGKREILSLPMGNRGDEVGRLYLSIRKMEEDIYEYIDNLKKVTAEKERIGAELSVATKIQASLLPNVFPPFPGRSEFDIYATMTPAKEVGGDFYDFFLIDDDHLALTIADVPGKGVPAALFMVITKVLLKNSLQTGKAPHEVLEEVNRQLCANNSVEMFVTVWIGILEISTGKLTCSNAGHEYPVVRRAGDNFELLKDKHGFVLAGMDSCRYSDYELHLNQGDEIFVYTDGVPEATDSGSNMFGTNGMTDALNNNRDAAPVDFLPRIKSELDSFVGDAAQFDDITMMLLRYNG